MIFFGKVSQVDLKEKLKLTVFIVLLKTFLLQYLIKRFVKHSLIYIYRIHYFIVAPSLLVSPGASKPFTQNPPLEPFSTL